MRNWRVLKCCAVRYHLGDALNVAYRKCAFSLKTCCHTKAHGVPMMEHKMRSGNVIAIPKSSNLHHVRDNRKAAELWLSDDQLKRLDQVFTPPSRKTALEML